MINHVVLFKFKEFETPALKQEALNQFESKLLALKNVIPELKYIEVGKHYQLNSPSFDLCLITHFENADDLETYRVHPEHKKVIDFAAQVVADRAAVDYKF